MPTVIDCAGDMRLAEEVYDYLLLHLQNPSSLSAEGDRISSPETGEHFRYEISEVLAAFVSSHHTYAGCILSMHGGGSSGGGGVDESTFTLGRPAAALAAGPAAENRTMGPQG